LGFGSFSFFAAALPSVLSSGFGFAPELAFALALRCVAFCF
jgi:hypothetical protein